MNSHKLRELAALFEGAPIALDPLPAGIVLPEETGASFLANARLKARAAAKATGRVALADDSGLEVDALGGEPGIRSARYAGEDANDLDNNRLLERSLEMLGHDARQNIGRSARRERHDQRDRPIGIGAGTAQRRGRRKPRQSGEHATSVSGFHDDASMENYRRYQLLRDQVP